MAENSDKAGRVRSVRRSTPPPCEQAQGEAAGTVLLEGVTFTGKPVVWADIDGMAVVEGDIVIGTAEQAREGFIGPPLPLPEADEGGVERSVGITGAQFRWPNARVPYEIDPAMPDQARVTDAIAHWHANTHIRLVPRNGEADFVRFVAGSGCSSSVGRRGGEQQISLGSGCTAGNAIHEIGHTLGLWHEQSREDRDSFVTIQWANIQAGMEHNFNQHITDGDDLGAYDFGSIMHYPRFAFSSNGQPTIEPISPLPAGVVMGQRNALSAGDIAGIQALYPQIVKSLANEPFTLKELVKDPFSDPVTIKEPNREPFTIKELVRDPVTIRESFGTIQEGTGSIAETVTVAEGLGGFGQGGQVINPQVLNPQVIGAQLLNPQVLGAQVLGAVRDEKTTGKDPFSDPVGVTEPPAFGQISPDGMWFYLGPAGGWVPIVVDPYTGGGWLPFTLQRPSAFGEQYQSVVNAQSGVAAPVDAVQAAASAYADALARLQAAAAALQAALAASQGTQP